MQLILNNTKSFPSVNSCKRCLFCLFFLLKILHSHLVFSLIVFHHLSPSTSDTKEQTLNFFSCCDYYYLFNNICSDITAFFPFCIQGRFALGFSACSKDIVPVLKACNGRISGNKLTSPSSKNKQKNMQSFHRSPLQFLKKSITEMLLMPK